jgi:hypothetical protein
MRGALKLAILSGAVLAAAPVFASTYECGTEAAAPTTTLRWTEESNRIEFLAQGRWKTIYGSGTYCAFTPSDTSSPVECPFDGAQDDSPTYRLRNLLCQRPRADGSATPLTTGQLYFNPQSGIGRFNCRVQTQSGYGFKLAGCHLLPAQATDPVTNQELFP